MDLSGEARKFFSGQLIGFRMDDIPASIWEENLIPEIISICSPHFSKLPEIRPLREFLDGKASGVSITSPDGTVHMTLGINASDPMLLMPFRLGTEMRTLERVIDTRILFSVGDQQWIRWESDIELEEENSWKTWEGTLKRVELFSVLHHQSQYTPQQVGIYIFNKFVDLLKQGVEVREKNLGKMRSALERAQFIKGRIRE